MATASARGAGGERRITTRNGQKGEDLLVARADPLRVTLGVSARRALRDDDMDAELLTGGAGDAAAYLDQAVVGPQDERRGDIRGDVTPVDERRGMVVVQDGLILDG